MGRGGSRPHGPICAACGQAGGGEEPVLQYMYTQCQNSTQCTAHCTCTVHVYMYIHVHTCTVMVAAVEHGAFKQSTWSGAQTRLKLISSHRETSLTYQEKHHHGHLHHPPPPPPPFPLPPLPPLPSYPLTCLPSSTSSLPARRGSFLASASGEDRDSSVWSILRAVVLEMVRVGGSAVGRGRAETV